MKTSPLWKILLAAGLGMSLAACDSEKRTGAQHGETAGVPGKAPGENGSPKSDRGEPAQPDPGEGNQMEGTKTERERLAEEAIGLNEAVFASLRKATDIDQWVAAEAEGIERQFKAMAERLRKAGFSSREIEEIAIEMDSPENFERLQEEAARLVGWENPQFDDPKDPGYRQYNDLAELAAEEIAFVLDSGLLHFLEELPE